MLLNSVLVMLGTTIGVVTLASMAAYVFARMEFRGREWLFNFFTLGLLFPIAVAILPLYITLRQINLVDSLWGIILPQIAFGLPGNILILRGFFGSIPRELDEAAAIDGCSPTGYYLRILLPLMRPALAAVAVLTMVVSWNNFFLPLLVINSEQLYTLPLGIQQFQGQFGTDWGRVLAFVTLSLVPTIGFYLLAERQIIAGLTAGAVKG
jgi:raffinose/stachyose/melibiose transport system permease protein